MTLARPSRDGVPAASRAWRVIASPIEASGIERDRFVDLVRVGAVALIVVGHWFVSRVWWVDGRVGATSAIAELPALQLASWAVVTVPLLFFVGGFANSLTLDACLLKLRGIEGFYRSRAARLLRPTVIFLMAWLVAQAWLHMAGWGGTGLVRGVRVGGTMPFGPLWFLGIYLAAVAATPLASRFHRHFGLWVPATMTVGTALVDATRFAGGFESFGWANLPLTWLLAHQLGVAHADGRLLAISRRAMWAITLGGLSALVLLTVFGPYPVSIGGTRAHHLSNMNPPTVIITALAWFQIGIVVLARPTLTRWLERSAVWGIVERLNRVVMTIYLWHMTAFLLTALALAGVGLDEPMNDTGWWLQRPLWIAISGAWLVAIMTAVGRMERRPAERHRRIHHVPASPGGVIRYREARP